MLLRAAYAVCELDRSLERMLVAIIRRSQLACELAHRYSVSGVLRRVTLQGLTFSARAIRR